MEKSTIFTIVLLGLGSLLLALEYRESIKRITKNILKILGVLLIVIATIISAFNSEVAQKEKRQFEDEVIKKLEKFNNDLKIAKKGISSEKQIRKIEKTVIEFNEWARDLKERKKLREIDLMKQLLEVEAKEYRLNSRWKHLFSDAFDYIPKLVSAYNKNSDEKVQYICKNEFPDNIFSKEAQDFKVLIKFGEEYRMVISIASNCFYSSGDLPCIILSNNIIFDYLTIIFNLKKKLVFSKLEPPYSGHSHPMEKEDSIDNYREFISNILKKYFEDILIRYEEYKLRKSRN